MTPCATSSKISSCLLSWSNTLSNLSAREFKTNEHIILKGKSNCEHYIMYIFSSAVMQLYSSFRNKHNAQEERQHVSKSSLKISTQFFFSTQLNKVITLRKSSQNQIILVAFYQVFIIIIIIIIIIIVFHILNSSCSIF